jgi:hypothetical protein
MRFTVSLSNDRRIIQKTNSSYEAGDSKLYGALLILVINPKVHFPLKVGLFLGYTLTNVGFVFGGIGAR